MRPTSLADHNYLRRHRRGLESDSQGVGRIRFTCATMRGAPALQQASAIRPIDPKPWPVRHDGEYRKDH